MKILCTKEEFAGILLECEVQETCEGCTLACVCKDKMDLIEMCEIVQHTEGAKSDTKI